MNGTRINAAIGSASDFPRTALASKSDLDLKSHGAADLLGSIKILLDRMRVSSDIGRANRYQWTLRPILHRERLEILGKFLGCDMRMLGLGIKKCRHVVS